MNEASKAEPMSCRLIRADGTEWLVSSFDIGPGGARVTARRLRGEGSVADAGARSSPAPETMSERPLAHGDRLVWVRSDGSVAWAMRNPTGVGLRWDERYEETPDDFVEEGFRSAS